MLVVASCAPAPLVGIGRATDAQQARASAPPVAAPVPPSPIAADYATTLTRVGRAAFVSAGHAGGRYAATVYVTGEAKDAMLAGRDVPGGTQAVMATTTRATHAAGPTFFMQKDAAGWRFGVVENMDARPDELALCARCHAEAPHDALFAVPE